MNLLPKHDILRRLAELIELKHRNVSASHCSPPRLLSVQDAERRCLQMGRAFMQYDKNRDGSIDRDEFRQMLNDMGLTYASFCVYSSPGSLPLTLWVLAAGSPIRSLSS